MLDLLILLIEKNENGESLKSYKISENDKLGHLSGLIDFNNKNNLNIENIENMTSYEASLEVAKKGYVNIHVSNKIMIIYLPMYLSEEQYKWFKDNMGLLSKFIISVSSEQLDGSFKSLRNEDNEEKYTKLNALKRELKRKMLLKEKNNMIGDNNEHRKANKR